MPIGYGQKIIWAKNWQFDFDFLARFIAKKNKPLRKVPLANLHVKVDLRLYFSQLINFL
jgi:hypothetical protein